MKRNQIEKKTIEALNVTKVFYGLEALKTLIEMNKSNPYLYSMEKLLNDTIEYQNELMNTIAPMLFDYTVLACYGELRHCSACSSFYFKNVGLKKERIDRNTLSDKVLRYQPFEILQLCVNAFDTKRKWNSAYGGKAWQNIAKHGLDYGKLNTKIWIDTSFSLSHNSSPYLDKAWTKIFDIKDSSEYKQMLDVKFHSTPQNTINYIMENSVTLDNRLVRLFYRAYKLKLVFLDNYDMSRLYYSKYSLLNDISAHYKPLRFRNKHINPIELYSFTDTAKQKRYYDSIQCGYHAMINTSAIVTVYSNGTYYRAYNHLVQNLIDDGSLTNDYSNLVIIGKDRQNITLRDLNNYREIIVDFRNIKIVDFENKQVRIK